MMSMLGLCVFNGAENPYRWKKSEPGWRKGTQIRFPEKGKDLVVTQKISLSEALAGYPVLLRALDGRSLTTSINNVIHPMYEEVVPREGSMCMPIPKEDSTKRGNLRIEFNIKFPARLTAKQKAGVNKLVTSGWTN